ncbi:MAG TPA: hemerythrin domain-containing protein [Solirubrobacteraceae bacterium]|nr:hemerythrin domain-containing protein [Solirubrobacteraceae bacterium]
MKRSEALAILSRDHHQALFVAQRLRRAQPETAAAERARFLEFWTAHGRRHFQLEEELLFPAYAPYGDAHHPLLLRALGEHVAIRALAARTDTSPEGLHELGEALAAHVRGEERELFAVIEEAMPPDELLALARELERAERQPAGDRGESPAGDRGESPVRDRAEAPEGDSARDGHRADGRLNEGPESTDS